MPEEIILNSECMVFTYKEGLLSRIAHDLKLRFEKHQFVWNPESSQLRATFDPNSLRVVCARTDGADAPGLLSEKDQRKIEQSIRNDVLRTSRYPSATLEGTVDIKEDGARFRGHLELCGVRRPLALDVQRAQRWNAQHRLDQTNYGIKPFSAALGTLKIKSEVDVQVSIELIDGP